MKTKILHIVPSVSAGGIESLVLSLHQNINKEKYHFDIAAFNPNEPIHKDAFEKLGANVYFISDAARKRTLTHKILWRVKALKNYYKLLKNNNYDVIHCHNHNNYAFYILLASVMKVPKRIVHSHTAGSIRESNFIYYLRRLKNLIGFEFLITDKIGCSDYATKWLYGKNSLKIKKARTIYNGVDISRFNTKNFSKEIVKDKYNFKDGIHFINIGRFSPQKNQFFLIDIFIEMSINLENIYLHIVGFGNYEKELKLKTRNLNLQNNIQFYDRATDIPEILSACDYFLLPSLWEGFPITALEAQASNLPIFISDTVTNEVDLGLAYYLPINKGSEFWVKEIISIIENKSNIKKIDQNKLNLFDIKNIVKQFEELYLLKFSSTKKYY